MQDNSEKAKSAIQNWELGQTSRQFESGRKGPETISSGSGDHGGVSYGSYQLSSKQGTLNDFLKNSDYREKFSGLTPTSKEFNARWVEIAQKDPNFSKAQHEFIKSTHYDIQVSRLEKMGFNISDRGKAVQDMVWSTSVQYRNKTTAIFNRTFQDIEKFPLLSDQEVIHSIQKSKLENHQSDFKNSSKGWKGIEQRIINEEKALLKLLDQEQLLNKQSSPEKGIATQGKSPSLSPDKQAFIEQARSAVNALHDRQPLPFDSQQRDNIAVALAHAGWTKGMDAVEHALLNTADNSKISLLNKAGPYDYQYTTLDAQTAAKQPTGHSLSLLADAPERQQIQHNQEQQHQLDRAMQQSGISMGRT